MEAPCSPLNPSLYTWTVFVYVYLSHYYTMLFSLSLSLSTPTYENVGASEVKYGLWIQLCM